MPPLADNLRTRLEKAVIAARDKAEEGARAALQRLYVDTADSKAIPAGFADASRALRVHLRAHARQLGDHVLEKGPQKIDRLVAECAYEFWHRMLFARFLAENDLLIHPESRVSISLEDSKEFAAEEIPPTDGWAFASRCASKMLPQIFRPDDPLLQVPFAPEHKLALEQILADLSADVFTAEDSLGWVYQFWQAKRKEEVNKSEVKIGGDELPAVTQLFTEHYMVLFLLHNTLGAWWTSKQATGGSQPADVKLPGYTFEYLRFRDDGTPAAGIFPGWPHEARELKVLDPCCGSGHFLLATFELLVRIRMLDEGLSARDACAAVLSDNVFGLELDARCTQIAAFNLALAAWKFPDAGGYRPLPQIHIACSGQAPKGKREEWLRLATGDKRLRFGIDILYDLFERANDLGSLINPRAIKAAPSMAGSFEELQPLLQQVLQCEEVRKDADLAEAGVMAQGIARAADLLARQYHLVVTNVPYLGRGRQTEVLRDFLAQKYPLAKADLATAFVERSLELCQEPSTVGIVVPHNWLFLASYKNLRERLFTNTTWNLVATLGPGAFGTISGEVVNVTLLILTAREPVKSEIFAGIDASPPRDPGSKAALLVNAPLVLIDQAQQLKNPDHRLILESRTTQHSLLSSLADSYLGLGTGDYARYGKFFWEIDPTRPEWQFEQAGVESTSDFGGREHVVLWDKKAGRVHGMSDEERQQIHNQDQSGRPAWGRPGVSVSLQGTLPVTRYMGEVFDKSMAVIVPRNPHHLDAIWAYCQSPEFAQAVRKLDKKVIVANGTLVKVPFDLAHWQSIADANGPLPKPHSDDPAQWLFSGVVAGALAPHNLQVAMARLLGYRWPDQTTDNLDELADRNGIVCLPAMGADKAASERLRELLAAAYGANWSATRQESLLASVGFGGKTLHDWLRDGFFEQHCRLFHNRPFLWHIWDGRKDGFSAVVNFQKFGEPPLRDLIYHHLSEWIRRQAKAVEKGESGADARHAAALELQNKLKLIHQGEKPYDLFVRWKRLDQQPIGWEPDLNDGVRVNIRPFMEADILRKKPKINWSKDKGRDSQAAPWFHLFKGDRINDHHLSLEEKRAARGRGEQR
jgi:hypothetical protein